MTLTPARSTAPAVGFATRLAVHADRPALVSAQGTLTYAELARRVEETAARLGEGRRLVLLAGRTTVATVTAYLAALSAGHVALLAGADQPEHLASCLDAYDPDVVVTDDGTGVEAVIAQRREGSAHDLHPDLALLLSTSGSTGSPKLVRLSHANLQSNAESIAAALDVRATDRAATTLPLHYCYGLSVLNSHLQQGASLLLTDLSVVAPCFWEAFRAHGATTLAGVPHTFDLLDRVGFAAMDLPTLRSVTQAGGRMAPERVQRFAALGRERGWSLHVMYGQTEATARMAYLPPALADEHPGSIGLPVPGGSFSLEPVEGLEGPRRGRAGLHRAQRDDGLCRGPADLARGPEVERLHTGDLARRTPEGLYEVIGRRSRFAKVVGLRLDLDRIERQLAAAGVAAHCADGGDAVVVVSPEALDERAVALDLAQRYGIPAGAVRVVGGTEPPRLPSGKPDYRAMAAIGADAALAQKARPACIRGGRARRGVGRADRLALRRPPRPTGRHHPELVRRPRRRLALLRGGLPAAGAAARDPPDGLAPAVGCGTRRDGPAVRALGACRLDEAQGLAGLAGVAPGGDGHRAAGPRDPAHPREPHPPRRRARRCPHPPARRGVELRPLPADSARPGGREPRASCAVRPACSCPALSGSAASRSSPTATRGTTP